MNQGMLGFPLGMFPLTQPQWQSSPVISAGAMTAIVAEVKNAVAYRLYSNTVPTMDGASLLGTYSSNIFTIQVANTTGNLVTNGNFESNTMLGWTNAVGPTQVEIVSPGHNSQYALQMTHTIAGLEGSSRVSSDFIRVVPGNWYDVAAYVKLITNTAPVGDATIDINVHWWDEKKVLASYDQVIFEAHHNLFDWAFKSASLQAPSQKMYMTVNIGIMAYFYSTAEMLVDDVTVNGAGLDVTSKLFAVTAMDINGNESQPSDWLSQNTQTSILGSPNSDHMLVDYTAGTIRSSNFVSGSAGVKVSPSGVEGACIVSPTEPTAPYLGMLWVDANNQLRICTSL